MNRITKSLCSLVALVAGTLSLPAAVGSPSDIIPRPTEILPAKGVYTLPAGFSPADVKQKITGKGGEGYQLKITPRGITVTAGSEAGAYYAVQSLRQMISGDSITALECCTVNDSPRFPYRGLHFDVSRHFRSVDFLKKQIDAMALMKLNKLHLHFTDGAGWRMQIDRYPRLTEFAAWRPQAKWSDWTANGAKYCESTDPNAAGGFYTKEELRDLIDYAAGHHITIIPEIEMPGHSEEVLAAYPELSCTGEQYGSSDLCPGKEATFEFLQNVLDEVIEVFPSHYIHIGGDEASKARWRDCPDCQARIKAENLDGVDGLQSYLIHRIEKYLNSKGRSIIGWDEILEGGVAPNATVMSWRGTEGGIRSLKSGHDVVMTPGEFCYIDYCQDAPFREPESIGGYTPLAKVYSYEPVEPGLTEEDASHLLGVQANLWAEYVPADSHAEYMYYPRTYAIAEIGWSTPEKNYDDFHRRALKLNDRMIADGYTPFDLANEYGERRESLTAVDHAGRGAKVTYANPYNSKYTAAGDATLTDGIRGGWTYGDRRWQGFSRDVDLTVDLGEVKPVNYVGADFMHSYGAWVHLPDYVEISTSEDGKNFTEPVVIWNDVDATYPKIMFKNYGTAFADTKARYIRLKAKQNPRPGAWLFMDEIVIN